MSTPDRFRTLERVHPCGASTLPGHGIPGTMWSGVLAAARVAGPEVLREVAAR